MLDSLYIKNFRVLKELKIDSLSQVNLITGKNNTGKSTILEALAIYASRGDLSQIYQLLNYRGEDYRLKDNIYNEPKEIVENNLRSLSSMFTNRKTIFTRNEGIQIGSNENRLNLRFAKYMNQLLVKEQGETYQSTVLIPENKTNVKDFKAAFEIKLNYDAKVIPLDETNFFHLNFEEQANHENYQLIRTCVINKTTNSKLFDHIALTDKENYVIEALRIIEPTTERIAFIENRLGERTAVIKLPNQPKVLPLQSMGDGINRILTIILAMVNADNGYFLLDEFENGLHYSVQEQLWKIIFKLAQELNVQVFATTHSNDCIAGFEQALNDQSNQVSGKLIRLDNINGTIRPVTYSPDEIKIATNQNIEVR